MHLRDLYASQCIVMHHGDWPPTRCGGQSPFHFANGAMGAMSVTGQVRKSDPQYPTTLFRPRMRESRITHFHARSPRFRTCEPWDLQGYVRMQETAWRREIRDSGMHAEPDRILDPAVYQMGDGCPGFPGLAIRGAGYTLPVRFGAIGSSPTGRRSLTI